MRRAGCSLLVIAALGLGGCNPIFLGAVAAPKILDQEKVNLLNSSFAAIDVLMQQAQKKVRPEDIIIVADPVEERDPEKLKTSLMNPRIGEVLGIQYYNRLTQLGYTRAKRSNVRPGAGQVFLEGAYQIKTNDFGAGQMSVTLHLIDAQGNIVGRHDYSLPMTYDIKKYMTRGENTPPAMPHMF